MTAETAPEPRLIKRYANRKMYDTERSCYITLEEVAAMVRAGEDVKVIDNKSKEDLTEVTLTQALLDSKRKKRSGVSLVELRKMIASGSDLLQQRIGEPVTRAQRDVERTVSKWRSGKGPVKGESKAEGKGEERPEEPEVEAAVEAVGEELSAGVERGVRQLFAKLVATSEQSTDTAALVARIEALEARVAELEKKLAD